MMNVQRGKQASMKSFTSANTLFLLVPEGMYTGSSKKNNVLTIRPSCIFIGPESDHWQCLSVTHSITHCCLVNLIDVTLACEDAYSKLEVVTIAGVGDGDCVGNSLLQIWKLRFGQKS